MSPSLGINQHVVSFQGFEENLLQGIIYSPQSGASLPGVLFCHGYNTDHREFNDFPERIAAKGFVGMVFDYSGHGDSQGVPTLFTADSHKADTLAAAGTLKRFCSGGMAILGHSLGAHMALRMLVETNLFRFGILVAPMCKGGDSLPFFYRTIFKIMGFLCQISFRLIPDIYWRRPHTNFEDGQKKRGTFFGREKCDIKYLAYSWRINDPVLARKIKSPVLVYIAAQDEVVSPRRSEAVFQSITMTDKKKVILESCGHDVFWDERCDNAEMAQEISGFLREHF